MNTDGGSAGLCDLCWEGEPKHFNVCAVPVLSRLSSFNNRGDDPKGNVSPTSALPLLLRDEMESILLPDPVLILIYWMFASLKIILVCVYTMWY